MSSASGIDVQQRCQNRPVQSKLDQGIGNQKEDTTEYLYIFVQANICFTSIYDDDYFYYFNT